MYNSILVFVTKWFFSFLNRYKKMPYESFFAFLNIGWLSQNFITMTSSQKYRRIFFLWNLQIDKQPNQKPHFFWLFINSPCKWLMLSMFFSSKWYFPRWLFLSQRIIKLSIYKLKMIYMTWRTNILNTLKQTNKRIISTQIKRLHIWLWMDAMLQCANVIAYIFVVVVVLFCFLFII